MDTKYCKVDNTALVKKPTKNSSARSTKSFYYTAYYSCPTCKRIYHDDAFKVLNNTQDLFSRSTILKQDDPTVQIWTDGACTNNGTPQARASWGFVVGEYEMAGLVEGEKQTNNRGEGLAIYNALLWAASKGHRSVQIHTDSQITIHGVSKHPDKVKENRDIFQMIHNVVTENNLSVEYIKVRGHADDVGNNRADEVATAILAKL
ncbi:MAG: hypothetical protein KBC15_04150 [Candidatus Levybacteria bacterium]|nr:hypothetical protein [Candidatus Levybacteria bacterium]